jgi:transcriptional regulator with PAS, ATPase and Fis domain
MDMDEGKFGRDLYFRFEEKIHLLPLRERKREIALLAHFFLDEFSKEMKVQSRGITPQAMRCLLSYQWPGNVRELKDCIRSALAKSNGVIFYHHLPLQIQDLSPVDDMSLDEGIPRSLDEVEMFHIKEVLHYTRGNKEKAASILGISKQTLYNKIEKYNLNI